MGVAISFYYARRCEPRRQNGQSKPFSRRVSAANRGRGQPAGLPQTEAHDAQRGGPPLESPCRQLSLVLSFASKESTFPPRCGSPTVRAGVGASGPRQELLSAKLPYNAACMGFPLAPCIPSVRLPKRINNPTGLYLHSRAGVGASISVSENCLRQR